MSDKKEKKIVKGKEVPEKQFFDVKMEVMVPCTLTYRVLAETPEKALEMIKYQNPRSVQYRLNLKRNIKALVYKAATVMLQFSKNF